MVFLVHRADDHRTEPVDRILPSGGPHPRVVVVGGSLGQDRVPVGEVEDHDVASFDTPESLEPAVVVLDERGVGLLAERYVVRERDRERGLGHPGSIGELAYKQMVSGVERALHGGGRNLEGLEEEHVDERDDNHREDDRVEPVEPHIVLLSLLVLFFPEEPLHLLGDEEVEDDDEAEQPPIVPEPDHPRGVEQGPEAQLDPAVTGDILQAHGFETTLRS